MEAKPATTASQSSLTVSHNGHPTPYVVDQNVRFSRQKKMKETRFSSFPDNKERRFPISQLFIGAAWLELVNKKVNEQVLWLFS